MRSQVDAVRREYGFLATWYDRIWSRYVRRSVTLTLPYTAVNAGQRILDVGCGTGQFLEQLDRRTPGAALIGIDLTPPMLHVARLRLLGHADVMIAEASRVPFASGTFDVVVSTSVIHYLPPPTVPVLREWLRSLRPGGSLVIADWCRDYVNMRVLDHLLRRIDPAHGRVLTAMELRSALIEAGYTDVEVRRRRMGWFWGMVVATAIAPPN